MVKLRSIFSLYFFCIFLTASVTAKEITFESIYGKIQISDPLIMDLLETPSMKRLKDIDQHGVYYFRKDSPTFSRHEHCVGVYYLLKRYNVSIIEQAAGLIHDISHTTFSHLSDIIYDHDEKTVPYQDSIHYWYLNKTNLLSVVSKYNYTINDLLFKNGNYLGLEQSLPDICADRLEYNLHTGYVYNFLTKEDIQTILKDLSFEEGRWFFNTPTIAKKFASLSLYFTEHFWGSDWNVALYKLSASAFQRALNLKTITFDDLHFSTDKLILEKLVKHPDAVIQSYLKKCSNYTNHYSHGTKEHHNYAFFPKFRGINPWIKVDNQFFRLTTLDFDFSLEYQRVKKTIENGLYLNVDLSI
jgi:uncharacterized protein